MYVGGREKTKPYIYLSYRYFINYNFCDTLQSFPGDSNANWKTLRISLYIAYPLHLPLTFFFYILTSIATRGYPAIWDDTGVYVADGKRYFSLRDLWNIFNSLEVTADRSCRSDPFQPQWSMMALRGTLHLSRMCARVYSVPDDR